MYKYIGSKEEMGSLENEYINGRDSSFNPLSTTGEKTQHELFTLRAPRENFLDKELNKVFYIDFKTGSTFYV